MTSLKFKVVTEVSDLKRIQENQKTLLQNAKRYKKYLQIRPSSKTEEEWGATLQTLLVCLEKEAQVVSSLLKKMDGPCSCQCAPKKGTKTQNQSGSNSKKLTVLMQTLQMDEGRETSRSMDIKDQTFGDDVIPLWVHPSVVSSTPLNTTSRRPPPNFPPPSLPLQPPPNTPAPNASSAPSKPLPAFAKRKSKHPAPINTNLRQPPSSLTSWDSPSDIDHLLEKVIESMSPDDVASASADLWTPSPSPLSPSPSPSPFHLSLVPGGRNNLSMKLPPSRKRSIISKREQKPPQAHKSSTRKVKTMAQPSAVSHKMERTRKAQTAQIRRKRVATSPVMLRSLSRHHFGLHHNDNNNDMRIPLGI